MHDLVGGGFHRYSVDARWLVPHFEKMLYDNALLASAYLHAWVVTGEERYREITQGTVEYMLRELLLPGGGLASAHDADTDGVEGLTHTWTEDELQAQDIDPACLEQFIRHALHRLRSLCACLSGRLHIAPGCGGRARPPVSLVLPYQLLALHLLRILRGGVPHLCHPAHDGFRDGRIRKAEPGV
jgi:hypothetical protein